MAFGIRNRRCGSGANGGNDMRMETARTQIVEFGRRLVTARLTTGTGGNLSFFDRKEGLVAI